MRARLLDTAEEFLDATLDLRAADPVRTNVLGSVALGVVEGASYDAQSWFLVEGDDGTAVGAALWTVPYRLLCGPMDDQAAHALGRTALARSQELGVLIPGVVAPLGVAEVVAAGVGGVWSTAMRERILVLHDYLPPSPVSGAGRGASDDDLDLLVEWHRAFVAEAGLNDHGVEEVIRRNVSRLWIWEVDGVPVSYAGHAPVVPTPAGAVGRVGPVYTPPEHRNRGYGTAVTAHVVEQLLPVTSTVMLYTDDANPTSNHVYENLGFVHEDDVVELAPVDAAGG